MQFTIYSRKSIEMLDLLDNLEIDAGITYLENEPLGRVSTVPLYQERYRLLTSADAPSVIAIRSPGRRSRRCRFAC